MNKILTFFIIFISVKQAFCGDPTLDILQKEKASLLDIGLIRLNMMMNEGKRQELAKSLSYLYPIVELRDNPKADFEYWPNRDEDGYYISFKAYIQTDELSYNNCQKISNTIRQSLFDLDFQKLKSGNKNYKFYYDYVVLPAPSEYFAHVGTTYNIDFQRKIAKTFKFIVFIDKFECKNSLACPQELQASCRSDFFRETVQYSQ